MPRGPRRLLYIVGAVASCLALGTTGYVTIDGYPPFEAFYMALTTMMTVGYAEIRPLSPTGRVFNIVFILIGVSVIFLAIGLMTQMTVEMEVRDYPGRRRFKKMIDTLEGHIIVCGYGRVGRGAARELHSAGAKFVIVETDVERVERAARAGMLAVRGDATRDETLQEVGINRARGIIVALATDADNLFTVLSAKAMNPSLHVAARATDEQAGQKLRRAGADSVLAPYDITGMRLAQSLLRPHVTQFLEFTTGHQDVSIAMEEVRVAPGSGIAGRSLAQLQLRRELGVIVLAIRRASGEMLFNPPAEAVIAADDFLIVMGELDRLERLERELAEVKA